MLRYGAFAAVLCLFANVGRADDEELTKFTSKAGKFSVSLPGKPMEQTKKVPAGGMDIDMFMFIVAPSDDRVYLVTYSDYDKALVTDDNKDAILDGAAKGSITNLKGKTLKNEEITIGKHPGRELLVELPNKSQYRAQIYLVNNRLYQVVALGPKSFVKSETTDDYFKSFKLAK